MRISKVETGSSLDSVRISRQAFRSEFHPLLIHCQEGYDAYVASVLRNAGIQAGREFWIAESEDGIQVGFAEFRLISQDIHLLSHLAVDPTLQGMGVGRALIREYLERDDVTGSVCLDVFRGEAAESFYHSLGFVEQVRKVWSLRAADTVDRRDVGVLASQDVHVLDATLREYGFGIIDVASDGRSMRLGFPSGTVVRVPSLEDLSRDRLLNTILKGFPNVVQFVHIGVVDDQSPVMRRGASTSVDMTFKHAARMSAHVDVVLEVLAARRRGADRR